MDGLYYSFLYIKAGGYPSRVRAGWMSSLINAGEMCIRDRCVRILCEMRILR